jgi:putative acetyltransferase
VENIEIVNYNARLKADFGRLNLEWMNLHSFKVSPTDEALFDNPESAILAKNGYIFFALHEGKAVGTCALIRESTKSFELCKMAVTPLFQGKHIGKRLLTMAVETATKAGARQVVLSTSTQLVSAIQLYKTFGFREIEPDAAVGSSCDLRLRLDLR